MRLFEHPDFDQAILAAQEHLMAHQITLSEQIIEKDYYVTEALRIIAGICSARVIFKGWNLIQRFSKTSIYS